MDAIFTIGHSTRSLDEFLDLLRENAILRLVDVRTIPRSRHNPQYEQTALVKSLPEAGVEYVYSKELGGLRPPVKDSVNTSWRNASFRNYADYMQTAEFGRAIDHLTSLLKEKPTVIMCAEAVPWRCHRSLIGDALLVRGVKVYDIIGPHKISEHSLTPFASVNGTDIVYNGQSLQ